MLGGFPADLDGRREASRDPRLGRFDLELVVGFAGWDEGRLPPGEWQERPSDNARRLLRLPWED